MGEGRTTCVTTGLTKQMDSGWVGLGAGSAELAHGCSMKRSARAGERHIWRTRARAKSELEKMDYDLQDAWLVGAPIWSLNVLLYEYILILLRVRGSSGKSRVYGTKTSCGRFYFQVQRVSEGWQISYPA